MKKEKDIKPIGCSMYGVELYADLTNIPDEIKGLKINTIHLFFLNLFKQMNDNNKLRTELEDKVFRGMVDTT